MLLADEVALDGEPEAIVGPIGVVCLINDIRLSKKKAGTHSIQTMEQKRNSLWLKLPSAESTPQQNLSGFVTNL